MSNNGSKILVVDDDEGIRLLFSTVLRRAGFEVETVENGSEVGQKVSAFSPDLIILDLIMPHQEGIETIVQLKAEQPKIPILAISGAWGADNYLHIASLLGVRNTLAKPIAPEELVSAVKLVLSNGPDA